MIRAEIPKDNERFWNRYARLYDFEIDLVNRQAYQQMYKLMRSFLDTDMSVLELATGTGLIAINVASSVNSIVATDFSPKMIAAAQRKESPSNVSFSVADATALPFGDAHFDAAIISNALHIMPQPELALAEIKRVLKPEGKLIAPTFSHGHISQSSWSLNPRILKAVGFETYSKWSPEEYVGFIEQNGFLVEQWQVLNAGFPLVYVEAHRI